MKTRWFAVLILAIAMSVLSGCQIFHRGGPVAEATSEHSMVLASYNLHVGKGLDGKVDLERIADLLTAQQVNVVGVQEVDRGTQRTGQVDQFTELKHLTGMNGVFGKSIDFQGGEYGIAILTTGEILGHRHMMHPVGEESERRSFLMAKIQIDDTAPFWVVNTHLGLRHNDRKAQIGAIREAIADFTEPVVIVGDLNETPEEEDSIFNPLKTTFVDAWVVSESKSLMPLSESPVLSPASFNGETFPADGPKRRIDYIWLNPAEVWTVDAAWVGDTQASDHLPLFVSVRMKSGQ